jgi:hypothetical protein
MMGITHIIIKLAKKNNMSLSELAMHMDYPDMNAFYIGMRRPESFDIRRITLLADALNTPLCEVVAVFRNNVDQS